MSTFDLDRLLTGERACLVNSDSELRIALIQSLTAMLGSHQWPLEVLVDRGVVTVNGKVDTHHTRFQIERAVRRVNGLRGVQINIYPTQAAGRNSDWQSGTLPAAPSRPVR